MLQSKTLSRTEVAFLVLGLIGFADAMYLTLSHYLGKPVVCAIFEGCDAVTTSAYSMIGPVPVALLGVFYYTAIIVLTFVCVRYAALLTPVGFLASVWFTYLQLFVINALCLYCLLSAAVSTTLFLLGMRVLLAKPNS